MMVATENRLVEIGKGLLREAEQIGDLDDQEVCHLLRIGGHLHQAAVAELNRRGLLPRPDLMKVLEGGLAKIGQEPTGGDDAPSG